MPSKQAEKISDDQAVKEITGGDYAVKESTQLATIHSGFPLEKMFLLKQLSKESPGPCRKEGANEHAVQTRRIPSMASWLVYELILSLLNSRIPWGSIFHAGALL